MGQDDEIARAYRKRVRVFGEVEASRNESRLGDWRARFLEGSTRCTGVCVQESTESIFTALCMKGEGESALAASGRPGENGLTR